MKDFDGVFTKRVLNALKTARFEALFVRDQGAMIGFGEVWLGHSRSGVGIHAINP